ncbi:hypothetical protein CASFOL_010497 [Castilleja foliolosa]|uniref:Uncharacterized protein n=1 Tax=Castilleja foliolosa TaxID=1961234 RepID=A0ABD3DUZ0_9LAMI
MKRWVCPFRGDYVSRFAELFSSKCGTKAGIPLILLAYTLNWTSKAYTHCS